MVLIQKRNFVTAAIIIYTFTLVLFFTLKDSNFGEDLDHCNYNSVCVAFCCNDRDTCSPSFIKSRFKESQNLTMMGEDFKILLGKPKCHLKLLRVDKKFSFSSVSRIFLNYLFKEFHETVIVWIDPSPRTKAFA